MPLHAEMLPHKLLKRKTFSKLIRTHSDILSLVEQDRIPGEPFEPIPTNEAEMEKILRSMEVINIHCLINDAFLVFILFSFCFRVCQELPA